VPIVVIFNARAPIVLPVSKNCCRCGEDFQDFSDRGLARVCAECKKPKAKPPRYSPSLRGRPLTARETQVVNLVAAGKPSKEIAYQLHLGEGTIKVAISTILAKTGLENRTRLAVWWITRQPLPLDRAPKNNQ
jgi:DNA-binding NarL/FixJ family response regulator